MPRAAAAFATRRLIAQLGGTSQAAALFELSPSRISDWLRDGLVPDRHHCRALLLAVERGLLWRPPGWDARVELRFNGLPARRRRPPRRRAPLPTPSPTPPA